MPESTPATKQKQKQKQLQWEKYKETWVGFDGEEVICVIARAEGAPLEMYATQFFNGCYVSVEAAKAAMEEVFTKTPPPTHAEQLAAMLRNALATLEGTGTPG